MYTGKGIVQTTTSPHQIILTPLDLRFISAILILPQKLPQKLFVLVTGTCIADISLFLSRLATTSSFSIVNSKLSISTPPSSSLSSLKYFRCHFFHVLRINNITATATQTSTMMSHVSTILTPRYLDNTLSTQNNQCNNTSIYNVVTLDSN